MAIRMRRGVVGLLDATKMLPGELGVTTDGGKLYYCYSAGKIKEVMTVEELQSIINAQPEAYEALLELIQELNTDTSMAASLLAKINQNSADILSLSGSKADKEQLDGYRFYKDVSTMGLSISSATLADILNAMDNYSILYQDISASSAGAIVLPDGVSGSLSLEIRKQNGSGSSLISIADPSANKQYTMSVSESGIPSGTWIEIGTGEGTGGLTMQEVVNTICNPDSYPFNPNDDVVTPALENGKISRSTGADEADSACVRTADYTECEPSTAYSIQAPSGYRICMLFYDSSKTFISGWNSGYSYQWLENGEDVTSPPSAAYVRFYTDDTSDTSTKISIYTGELNPGVEFYKQYFANGDYTVQCGEMDPGLWQYEIEATKNEFAIVTIRAPRSDPSEATLALMCSGGDTRQFVDFSCMRYDKSGQGSVEIVMQTRGTTTPMPEFRIAFNDGNGAGRVRKLVIEPDAIPMRMTANGLVVRRNNNYNNSPTDDELVTVNLVDLKEKVDAMYSALLESGAIVS